MKMDETYDGPTVAVLARTMSTVFGTATTSVVSVHRDEDDAAHALAQRIVVGSGLDSGWAVLTVPAPFLAAEPARRTGGGALGPQLWAALEPLGIAGDVDEAAMIERVHDLVGEVLDGDAVPSPAGDRRAAGEVPQSAVIELAEAVGWSASSVRGVPGSFARLLREVRNRADEVGQPRFRFVDDLRIALEPAVNHGTVMAMSRAQLLDLVRTLVEVANTPGGDPTEPKLNGLEAAYRAHWATVSDTPWESVDGGQQALIVRDVDRLVRAYLTGLVDGREG